jgi:hypothetical protein
MGSEQPDRRNKESHSDDGSQADSQNVCLARLGKRQLTEAEKDQTTEEQKRYGSANRQGARPRPPMWLAHDQQL